MTSAVYFQVGLAWFCLVVLWLSGLAYLLNKPTIFRKRSNGTVAVFISAWVFMPFLGALSFAITAGRRSTDTVPAITKIDEVCYLA